LPGITGGEFGQWREWTETESLDWHLLDDDAHIGVQKLMRDLNRVYSFRKSLWQTDGDPEGFDWIDVNNAMENIVAFLRRSHDDSPEIICVGNFSALQKKGYRLGLPRDGEYQLLINTDDKAYGGKGREAPQSIVAEETHIMGRQFSAVIDLPALSTMWFEAVK